MSNRDTYYLHIQFSFTWTESATKQRLKYVTQCYVNKAVHKFKVLQLE